MQWHGQTQGQTRRRQTDRPTKRERSTCVSLKSRSRMWCGRRFLSRLTCSSAKCTDGRTPAAFSPPLGDVSGNSPAMYIRWSSTSGWNDIAIWGPGERTRRTRRRRRKCDRGLLTPSLGGMCLRAGDRRVHAGGQMDLGFDNMKCCHGAQSIDR